MNPKLRVGQDVHEFEVLTTIQQRWNLPPEFNIAYFEPKDWSDLGSMEGAGAELQQIRRSMMVAVPKQTNLANVLTHVDALAYHFRRAMIVANEKIGLRPVEIDFAVSGFDDVMRAVAYRLIELGQMYPQAPQTMAADFDFGAIYQAWLDDSAMVSGKVHTYEHDGQQFSVQVIYNAYGRFGLAVSPAHEDDTHYVFDPSLACPAADYMRSLCGAVAERLLSAYQRGLGGTPSA